MMACQTMSQHGVPRVSTFSSSSVLIALGCQDRDSLGKPQPLTYFNDRRDVVF